jgi:hypothetical protein
MCRFRASPRDGAVGMGFGKRGGSMSPDVKAVLYAVRLLFWQSMIRSLFAAGQDKFDRVDLVIDCFVPVTFTLFLIHIVEPRWKNALRGVVAAQLVLGTIRLTSTLLHVNEKAMSLGAAPFSETHGGLFRSFEKSGNGKYKLHAHVRAGNLTLR